MRVAVAFDHRGVKLRERVLEELAALGHDVVDLGTDTDAVRIDYPDKAREVGEAILAGDAERGVLVCGSGVGASVAACKLAGIRAAICHDVYSAHQGVEHDDMNVLCLGSEVVGAELAADLVRVFLGATFRRRRALRATSRRRSRIWKGTPMGDSRLHQLSALGQSVWIDYLSRDLLHSGELARMMDEDAVTGVTSNPTIFQKAISQGNAYDDQMRDLLEHEQDPKEIFIALAGRDIGEACDLMRKVWDEGKGLRGYVSLEVDPNARRRHRGDDRRGEAARRARRQAEPVHQDPRDEARPARDRGDDRRAASRSTSR